MRQCKLTDKQFLTNLQPFTSKFGVLQVIEEVLRLNEDPQVHGVFLCLTPSLLSRAVLNSLNPEKDVDGYFLTCVLCCPFTLKSPLHQLHLPYRSLITVPHFIFTKVVCKCFHGQTELKMRNGKTFFDCLTLACT